MVKRGHTVKDRVKGEAWWFRKSNEGPCWSLMTPHNREFGRIECSLRMIQQIVGTFNFARNLKDACETKDMVKIQSFLLASRKVEIDDV